MDLRVILTSISLLPTLKAEQRRAHHHTTNKQKVTAPEVRNG